MEMGALSARPVSWKVKMLVSGYLKLFICGGDADRITKAKKNAHGVLESMPELYRAELQAYAASAGVDPDMLAFGNSFVDLGSRALGCRSTVIQGKRIYHAHNLDWDNLGGMAKWSVIITRRHPDDGRFKTVSIGFPGLIGALDIVNEHGVALSFNQLGTGAKKVTEPVFVMMRRIAEPCPDFASARSELLNPPAGMPFVITLSSASEHCGSIFERWGDVPLERSLSEAGWVAAANGQQGVEHGLSCVGRVLKEGVPQDVEAVKALLRHPDVLAACNLYSVIFDYEANRFYLASGALPAAAGTYREYDLFEKNDG
jgi:hypothetical protein